MHSFVGMRLHDGRMPPALKLVRKGEDKGRKKREVLHLFRCYTHTRRRLHSRVFCLVHSLAPNHHPRAFIALSWQILFGLWRYPAVVSPPFGNTNDFNVHGVCGARHSRRYYDIAAGWHSRPGFDVFSKTAQDPTNEKHHLLSQVLNDAFL